MCFRALSVWFDCYVISTFQPATTTFFLASTNYSALLPPGSELDMTIGQISQDIYETFSILMAPKSKKPSQCQVCLEEDFKYTCPQCRIVQCVGASQIQRDSQQWYQLLFGMLQET